MCVCVCLKLCCGYGSVRFGWVWLGTEFGFAYFMFLSRKLLRCSRALSRSHTLSLSFSPSLVAYRGKVNYYEISVRFQVQLAMNSFTRK